MGPCRRRGRREPPEGWIESDPPGIGSFSGEEDEPGAGATTNLRSAPGLSRSTRNTAGQASSGTLQGRSDSAENEDLPPAALPTLEIPPSTAFALLDMAIARRGLRR